ncbi:MAG: hypothetical protein LBM98_10935 [Oscillospiraceae bacterium]|nr:hypothetical protein [Oscillospiraceae bacterium]
MLRTCTIVRIAGVPVLRKDGALRRDGGRWTGVRRERAGLKPAPTLRDVIFILFCIFPLAIAIRVWYN